MTFRSELPSECSQLIFSFLDIADCIRFGATSLSMMKEVMPSLNKHRLRMQEQYCVEVTKKYICPDLLFEERKIVKLDCLKHPYRDLVSIPTSDHYVSELSRVIPTSHPLSGTVRELHRQLQVKITDDTLTFVAPFFMKLFPIFRSIVGPLKLYMRILAKVLRSDPLSRDAAMGKVALDEYIGDVLCLTYLLRQDNPNLGELNPLVDKLLDGLRQEPGRNSPYLSWILLHSTILRTKKFSVAERKRLGISGLCCVEATPTVVPIRDFVNEMFMSSQMTLILDTFGHLGSSFRLRDDVQIHAISSHCIFAFLTTIENSVSGQIIRGSAGQIATEWLCLAHEEARKSRPMTVRKPFVRISL